MRALHNIEGSMGAGQKPIVVVGSINMDLVADADHIPAPGETVHGSKFQTHSGGKGANQAVAVARLGYPVQMIGKLGADALGEQLWTHLQSEGVGLEGVERAETASGMAMIVVAADGENCIVVTPGANADVTSAYVERRRELIRNAGLVLTQLEIPVETVQHVAELCFEYEVPLILDPAPAQALPSALLKRICWFTPNEIEAGFYTAEGREAHNDADSHAIAQHLLRQGPKGVLLKLGPRGAYVATHEIGEQVSAMRVKAVDTTAAGDAFNGAFAVGLMLGKSPQDSVRFAVAAAALSVTRGGGQPSMPFLEEVQQMLDGAKQRR